MRFLVDAQLPRRIALQLRERGHDALHTLDLPEQNRTSDAAIVELAMREGRVVVTKDADFVDSFVLSRRPEKLLLISTGNVSNRDLAAILLPNLPEIVAAFETASFVEVDQTSLVVHL
jgi:predicted nuclease of predicted toxin-antitoxin system